METKVETLGKDSIPPTQKTQGADPGVGSQSLFYCAFQPCLTQFYFWNPPSLDFPEALLLAWLPSSWLSPPCLESIHPPKSTYLAVISLSPSPSFLYHTSLADS